MAMCFSQNVTYNLSIITKRHTLWQTFLSSTIPYPITFSEGLFLFLFPPKVRLSMVTPLFFKHSGNMECYPVTEIFHIFLQQNTDCQQSVIVSFPTQAVSHYQNLMNNS